MSTGTLRGFRTLVGLYEELEELDIPYVAVAVDLLKKKEIVFTEGSIMTATMNFTAIPMWM